VQAVLRRCLEPDLADRYPSARALQDALAGLLDKQAPRHAARGEPRGREPGGGPAPARGVSPVAAVAFALAALAALLAVLVARGQRLARLEAEEQLRTFRGEQRAVQARLLAGRGADDADLDSGILLCRRLLARYRVPDDLRWREAPAVAALTGPEREELAREVGGLLLLWARAAVVRGTPPGGVPPEAVLEGARALNERAEPCYPPGGAPRALWRQRAGLARRLGEEEEARRLDARAAAARLSGPQDRLLMAEESLVEGRPAEALPLLENAAREEPGDFATWFALGQCRERLGRDAEAAAAFGTCAALAPELPAGYLRRGAAYLRARDYPQALADFDLLLGRDAGLTAARVGRARACLGLGRFAEAGADLTRALESGDEDPQSYLLRAAARAGRGDAEGARRDRAEALRLGAGAPPAGR
jgi:tetratricopeptide (TPR) repeat protein